MTTNLDYFNEEISIILSYVLLLWWVYRQFNMDGFGPNLRRNQFPTSRNTGRPHSKDK